MMATIPETKAVKKSVLQNLYLDMLGNKLYADDESSIAIEAVEYHFNQDFARRN